MATSRVTAGSEGETVWMEVADDGIGIPEADRSRIFERFYRVDKARSRESGGTGLGLSIATEIVQRHHGSLTLVDRPGLHDRPLRAAHHPAHRREDSMNKNATLMSHLQTPRSPF